MKILFFTGKGGVGKTTLAAAWIAQSERPAAWLSLEEEDNDLARFLTYLVALLGDIRKLLL